MNTDKYIFKFAETIGLRVKAINAPQEVHFNQNSKDENGNPNYYIFIDSPEHITKNDVIDNEHKNRTLSLFKDLTPGTYTVFELHHKAVASTTADVEKDEAISESDALYYDAVFYNTETEGQIKITKLGMNLGDRRASYDMAWEEYKNDNRNLEAKINNESEKWITDISDNKDGILISDNESMGVMYLMMEFEVVSGTVDFATVAKINSNDFTDFDKEHAESTYKDHKKQVLKGKGSFAQEITADDMEYYIDDNMQIESDAYMEKEVEKLNGKKYSMLHFNIDTPVSGKIKNSREFSLNASALYYECKNSFPESAVLGLEYDGVYDESNQNKTFYFDTYHSPYVRNENVPNYIAENTQKYQWDMNEKFTDDWIKKLKDLDYNPYSTENEEIRPDCKEFENFLGVTNMQGYGITYKYNITIHNVGNDNKKICYVPKIAPQYLYKYNVYDGSSLIKKREYMLLGERGHNYTELVKVKGGQTIMIELEVTQMCGSSATNINKFVVY